MEHCFYIFIGSIVFTETLQHLHSVLRHFEILTPAHVRTRTRRESATKHVLSKTVSFHAFGRRFVVHLEPGSPVLDPGDLEVKLIFSNGSGTRVELNMKRFYSGHLAGDTSSSVDAAYVAGAWSMFIQGQEKIYIEPLQKHDGNGRARHMVIYRKIDIRMENETRSETRFCKVLDIATSREDLENTRDDSWSRFQEWPGGSAAPLYGHLPFLSSNISYPSVADSAGQRSKRESSFYFNTCDMLSIMDTAAYKGVGGGSAFKSAAMIVFWYQVADSIFKRADFGFFKGMRLKLRSIYIMTEFTPSARPHFNRDPALGQVHADEILRSMSNETWLNQYCLAHLTTQRTFKDSMLGLATTANAPVFDPDDYRYKIPFWKHGLCASNANNVAMSCIQQDQNVLTDAAYIVILVHEIAHGWGAMHDDGFHESECDPNEQDGGKYIMWPRHNGGKDFNSYTFSVCSAASIQEVLFYKAHKCLLPAHMIVRVCGNSLVEYPEQCDEGMNPISRCCTDNCRLKDNALCSPYNYPCCNDQCQTAPNTQRCYHSLNMSCLRPSYCDGVHHLICPTPQLLPNGDPCEDHGTCWNGRCLSYCENLGRTSDPQVRLQDCTCYGSTEAMCTMCCRNPATNSCIPSKQVMNEGMPCLFGFCKSGKCVGTLEYIRWSKGEYSVRKRAIMGILVFLVVAFTAPIYLIMCSAHRISAMRKKYRISTYPDMSECTIKHSTLTGKQQKGENNKVNSEDSQ